MKKTAILVLTHTSPPFQIMEECIRYTWGSENHPHVKIWYYYGGNDKFEVKDNNIYCPFIEGYENIGKKTICAFEYLLTTDFDYVFRPNSSSYVNIEKLFEFTQTLPDNLVYNGSAIPYPMVGECCSGCGFFLSRDLVKIIVDNKEKWNHYLIDDIALCEFLFNMNIKMTSSHRLKIFNFVEGNLYGSEGLVTDDALLNNFHITTRSGEYKPLPENIRETNCIIMKEIQRRIKELKNNT